MDQSQRNVTMFNPETGQKTIIPADELAPGMISVQIEDVGEVWVSSEQMLPIIESLPLGCPLDPQLRAAIEEIRSSLGDACALTTIEWEYSTRKVGAPSSAISVFLEVGYCLRRWIRRRKTTRAQRVSAFRILCSATAQSLERVLQVVDISPLSSADAAEIVALVRPPVESVLHSIDKKPAREETIHVLNLDRPEVRELVRTAEVGWEYDTFMGRPLPLFGGCLWAAAHHGRVPDPKRKTAISFRFDSRTDGPDHLTEQLLTIRGRAWAEEYLAMMTHVMSNVV